jgi:xanthine dehydrogenase iron-sulfur cluster and FAD-binding subunit A
LCRCTGYHQIVSAIQSCTSSTSDLPAAKRGKSHA